MSTDRNLIDAIKERFQQAPSLDLQEIAQSQDASQWSEEARMAALEVLLDREEGKAQEPSFEEASRPEPESASGRFFMRIAGAFVFVVGIGLIIGNMTGIFPTFPFAGFIVSSVGATMWGAGEVRYSK